MAAERFLVSDLPEGASMEVWGDNTAWLVGPEGAWRMPLREWADNMPRPSDPVDLLPDSLVAGCSASACRQGRVVKRRKLRTIDDLLTAEEREQLTKDLERIRDAVRPGFIGPTHAASSGDLPSPSPWGSGKGGETGG